MENQENCKSCEQSFKDEIKELEIYKENWDNLHILKSEMEARRSDLSREQIIQLNFLKQIFKGAGR